MKLSKICKAVQSQRPVQLLQPNDLRLLHGSLRNLKWRPPKVIYQSEKLARQDVKYYSCTRTEYQDYPNVLRQKIELLAKMIKNSKQCVAYTGAGISVAAGIEDYASDFGPSINIMPKDFGKEKPTWAHHAIVQMIERRHIKHWLQQNHDGLAQKAGCPIKYLNEIHGSWHDKSNPVVEMGKLLKHENFEKFIMWQELADMVISVGSTMAGMHSDHIVQKAIYKHKMFKLNHRSERARNQCQGVVILNFQQTQYSLSSSLNIFNDIDDTFLRLAKYLKIKIPLNPPTYMDRKQWK